MNPTIEGPWERRISTASLHVPEPQADLGSRSIRNPPLVHEGMRGNNVGMYGHSGAIRSARGCGQYYHSFFSMHPNYWLYCRTTKMNNSRLFKHKRNPAKILDGPNSYPRTPLLAQDSRFDPFSLSCKKAS